MIDPAKLAAFAFVTGLVSLMPGPQMVFVMTQAAWRGPRAGAAALAGLQLGNATWFVMAGLGLGTLALAWPGAFTALTAAGALYLAWLGLQALKAAGQSAQAKPAGAARRASRHALRDSLAVSLSNPKSLVYVLALLPPFVDPREPVVPQLALLAAIAITLDVTVGAIYVAAGGGLSAAMNRPPVRLWFERAIGTIFLALAAAILVELARRGGAMG
ncbi:MAG TPA: LysE family translocator [Croceibacterium sp.]|nr:LysE family translocator [Croceibacterium sp.]